MNPELSIIIPTKNREAILLNTLNYLIRSENAFEVEIIIVNDSSSPIKEKIHAENITYINNDKQGAASARNKGAKIAKTEYLLFLDDDMLITYDIINQILKNTKEHKNSVFLPNWEYPDSIINNLNQTKFGRFLNKINYTSLKGWLNNKLPWNENGIDENKGVASYCLLINKNDFLKISGYNESIPFAGFEDYDLSQKLISINYKFYILNKIILYHNETDRIDLRQWLKRKKRDATTRRSAYEIGYLDLKINYSIFKKIVYSLIFIVNPLIRFLAYTIPNIKTFDPIYQKLIKILIGHAIYLGYQINYEKIKN